MKTENTKCKCKCGNDCECKCEECKRQQAKPKIKDLQWAVESRYKNQKCALKLYQLLEKYEDEDSWDEEDFSFCHGSNQNRPRKIESKPASLRRVVHISCLASCKRINSELKRAGSASASLSSRSLRSKAHWPWVGFSSALYRPPPPGL
jgi:hypothetical protein